MTDNTKEHARMAEILAQATSVAVAIFISMLAIWCIVRDNRQIPLKDIEVRINPNNAPLGSLVRLYNIGVGKASAIIAYRESFGTDEVNVFSSPKDLEKVKGIGPKTVEQNLELLEFEKTKFDK